MKIDAQQIKDIQSFLGLAAFIVIFLQIVIARKFPKLHHLIPFLVFILILGHLAAYIFFIKKIKGIFDPFYPFTDLCLLCKNVVYPEYFINLGRVALWLMPIAIVFRKLWPKIHLLNYLAFYFIALHAWFLGNYALTSVFKWIYWGSIIIVTLIVLKKLFYFIIKRQSSRKI